VFDSAGRPVVNNGQSLVRLRANGELDASFSTDGEVTLDDLQIPSVNMRRSVQDMLAMPDSSLIVAAMNTTEVADFTAVLHIKRIDANGTIDLNFGDVVTFSGVATQPALATKLLTSTVGGLQVIVQVDHAVHTARFGTDGKRVAGYPVNGSELFRSSSPELLLADAVVIPSGGLRIAHADLTPRTSCGKGCFIPEKKLVVLSGFGANAALDSTYGSAGQVQLEKATRESVVLAPDGSAYVVDDFRNLTPVDKNGVKLAPLLAPGVLIDPATATWQLFRDTTGNFQMIRTANCSDRSTSQVFQLTSAWIADAQFGVGGRFWIAPSEPCDGSQSMVCQ
jgi:hypothetical protein